MGHKVEFICIKLGSSKTMRYTFYVFNLKEYVQFKRKKKINPKKVNKHYKIRIKKKKKSKYLNNFVTYIQSILTVAISSYTVTHNTKYRTIGAGYTFSIGKW